MKQFIKNILGRFGFIHSEDITEQFLYYEVAKLIGDPTDYTIEPEQEETLFRDLSRVDGFSEYLRATMAKDMLRDFSSGEGQHQLIHGAFARTAYLRSKMASSNERQSGIETRLAGKRYG